jgi:hypothetical protein
VDVFTARAAAVDGSLTSLNLYILRVAFVRQEERSYGGFLVAFFYHMVVIHDGPFPLSASWSLTHGGYDAINLSSARTSEIPSPSLV